jgi:hypothetical protein
MPTKNITHVEAASSTVEAPAAATPPAPATVSPLPAPAPTSAPVIYLTPPPSDALIPAVPSNFVPESGTTYRSVAPKKAELVALPLAVSDLKKFSDYAQVLGATAPPYAEILQTFDVTNQWSSMRTSSLAWDVYGRDQEGICWTVMRPGMESLKSSFDLAAQRDPSLLAKFPGLAALLGVKKVIAVKAASTRRANKKAVAEGKPATHGQAGKKRAKAADKAIVAAANAAAKTPVEVSAPAPTAPVAPAVSAAPVTATSAVVTTSAPAPVVAPANGVPTSTNGASH